MWDNPVGFLICHYQRIDSAKKLWVASRHALRYHAFRKISARHSQWSDYKGHYRWIVKLLQPFATLWKIYYGFHSKKCKQD